MVQIQGVQGRMPYAAALQQPATASPWHALVYTRAGDCSILLFLRTAAFPTGKKHGNFSRLFGSHDLLTPKISIHEAENLVILFFNHPLPCFLCNDRVYSHSPLPKICF
jgi:hypothetical protein